MHRTVSWLWIKVQSDRWQWGPASDASCESGPNVTYCIVSDFEVGVQGIKVGLTGIKGIVDDTHRIHCSTVTGERSSLSGESSTAYQYDDSASLPRFESVFLDFWMMNADEAGSYMSIIISPADAFFPTRRTSSLKLDDIECKSGIPVSGVLPLR